MFLYSNVDHSHTKYLWAAHNFVFIWLCFSTIIYSRNSVFKADFLYNEIAQNYCLQEITFSSTEHKNIFALIFDVFMQFFQGELMLMTSGIKASHWFCSFVSFIKYFVSFFCLVLIHTVVIYMLQVEPEFSTS